MKVQIIFILSFATLTLALRNCVFCKFKNDGNVKKECDPYLCLNRKSRCLKLVTEENNVKYITRTCGAPDDCDGKDEKSVDNTTLQPGKGTMYCCDTNACNTGSTIKMKTFQILMFVLSIIMI